MAVARLGRFAYRASVDAKRRLFWRGHGFWGRDIPTLNNDES